ncbi:MAG: hypothetical protein J5597_08415, partial [Spirochaetaceae bacterium]|nr:hypothetical protein [Spirochaetaceae bacterium]
SSAGGYAAVLFGCLLEAKKIFSISGQFYFTDDILQENTLVHKHLNELSSSKYYDLNPLLSNFNGTVFYTYPCYSEIDIKQHDHIKNLPNIVSVKIKSDAHGKGPVAEHYMYMFFQQTKRIFRNIDFNKEYTPSELYKKDVPVYYRGVYFFEKCLYIFFKYIVSGFNHN